MSTPSPPISPPTSGPCAPWTAERLAQAAREFHRTVLKNPWIPQKPTERQAKFLLSPCVEGLYGGAAGGGKSSCLLMAAAQYVDVPGYAALLIRRAFPDLMHPAALFPR